MRKSFKDVLGEKLVDLPVSWHWLGNASFWIAIPVVIPAGPDEDASRFVQLAE